MNKSVVKFLILSICVMFTANSAFGWDAVGHKLTAYVAWERMTPDVREKVIKILLDAPEDSDLNVHYDAYNSRSEAIKRLELFMYAAIWSDVIRNRSFDVRYKNYHQGDWHYADIFWKQENGKATILIDFPEESGKAVPKLADFEKILKDSTFKTEEKAIALAWFLHVGGDIHNPVHNASRVTELDPKGDQGGNRFVLQNSDDVQRRINLHGYWDSIIGNVKTRKNDACDSDYLAPIARKLMKTYPYSKMQDRLELSDYKKWNAEGFDLLNEVVYQDISRDQMPSRKYQKRAFKVAGEQIALAGYRLGETLNKIFSQVNEIAENREPKPALKTEIDQQDAMAIWEKVKSVIDNTQPFKFIRVDIRDTTVTLDGIIANEELKKQAVEAIKGIEGVGVVIDNLIVDESILLKNAENEVRISQTIPAETFSKLPSECKIIRNVLYPVSKRRSPDQKTRIALIDICPENRGMVARPTTSIISNGELVTYEYDVVRVFKDEAEAKKYALDNKITDVLF